MWRYIKRDACNVKCVILNMMYVAMYVALYDVCGVILNMVMYAVLVVLSKV